MPFDDTINSSGIEASPPRSKRFANAGQFSIQQLIDNAVADRFSSKKEVRALTFTKGGLQQQYNHTLWLNRFNTYRAETLGARLDVKPSAEDIERFLTSIIKKVIPKSQHGVPSFDWMRLGIKTLAKTF